MIRDDIEGYEALVKRAMSICDGVPYWQSIDDNGTFAKLEIKGQSAFLMWPSAESDYDSLYLEHHSVEFPAKLLFVSETDLKEWKKLETRIYNEEIFQKNLREKQKHEEKEREMLAELKQKYETK